RHTRFSRDWSSDVCSSDLDPGRTPTLKNFSLRVSSSYIQGDFLQLAKTGEDFIRNWEDQEAWENPENSRLNTGSDPNGNLRLTEIGRASCRERVESTGGAV